jgi:hypothetical protein
VSEPTGTLRKAVEYTVSLGCGCTDSTNAEYHSKRCHIPRLRAALAAQAPEGRDLSAGAEMGTCDLVSRPHRRDHCGEAWRPLAAQPHPSQAPQRPDPKESPWRD